MKTKRQVERRVSELAEDAMEPPEIGMYTGGISGGCRWKPMALEGL